MERVGPGSTTFKVCGLILRDESSMSTKERWVSDDTGDVIIIGVVGVGNPL